MKSRFIFAGVVIAMFTPTSTFSMQDPYTPLRLYQGTWSATQTSPRSEPATREIANDCAMVGRFFACQQTVNGKPGAMIIFVPAAAPGDYYTQAVVQEGLATGRGELHIEGDRWTYSSKAQRDGKTVYHQTTNVFTGRNHIHFEQLESPDGKKWTVTMSGEEVRISKKPRNSNRKVTGGF